MDLEFWPRFSKCCCFISLKTGSFIIGYASLLTSAFALSGVSYSLHKVVYYMATHAGKPDPNGHSPEEIQKMALSLYISHAYFMLVLLYYCVISLLLIIGLHKNRTNYLRYYFNAALLLLVLAAALVVVTLVFFGIVASVPLLKWCVILFYCLIVVRSTYLEMEDFKKPVVYELRNIYNPEPQVTPLI